MLNSGGYYHGHFFSDFFATQYSTITCVFTGTLYASMFGYMLMNFADTFAWFCLVCMQLFLIGCSWLCFIFSNNAQDAISGTTNSKREYGWVHYDMEYVVYWFLFFGILFAIFSAVFYCIVFMQYKHIKIAIAIFDASADFAVNHIRLLIIVYIYFLVLIMTFWGQWYMMCLTMSLNDIYTEPSGGTYYK